MGEWLSQSVGDSFRFGDSYRISELCELVHLCCAYAVITLKHCFICIDFGSIFRTHILGGLLIKAALNPNRQFRLTLWVKRVVPRVKKGRNPLWSNPFLFWGFIWQCWPLWPIPHSGWHNLRSFLATWFDPESFPHSAYVNIFATFATKSVVF